MNFIARNIERRLRIDAQYFLHGGFWLIAAQGATILASLISTVFLTHYLDEHDFGVYRYIIGVGLFLTTLSLTGISQSIFQAGLKKISGFYDTATKATLQYSIGITLAGIGSGIYYLFQDNVILGIGCLMVGLLTPWSFLFQNIHGYLLGENKFKQATNLLTIKSFFVAATTIVALIFTSNILVLVGVYFMSQAIAGLLSHALFKPRDEILSDQPSVAKLMAFARHTSLRNVFAGIASRLDNLVVFQQLGGTGLAVFTIATLLPDQIKGSLKHVVTLLIPKFSQYDTVAEVRKFLPSRSVQAGLILVVVSIVTILITPFVIETLFPKYTAAIPYAQLLALSFPASIYQIPFAIMQAHTSEKALYSYHIYTSIFQIIFTFIGISFFGILGAVGARIFSQYAQLAVSWYAVYRYA